MGINLNVDFPPLNMGLIEISCSHFEAIQKLFVHPWPAIVCFGVFHKFFGDFWVYLGGNSFSRRIGKIRRNKF